MSLRHRRFKLTETEWVEDITNCDILGHYKFLPAPPLAFTEQGVAMLSGVIRAPKAVLVNISIMRAFVEMRRLLESNKVLMAKLNELEAKYDQQFQAVFAVLKELIHQEATPRSKIGYKQ